MKRKRFGVRLVACAALLCLTAALAAPSPAGAQTPEGVGTSKASHTLLGLTLGKASSPLLNLGVLADTAQSTIDSALEPANAFSKLVPVSLASGLLPGISGLLSALPTFESRTPGGNPSVSGSALNLGGQNGLLGLPLSLLGGSLIPTSLTSALDGAGARSGLDAKLLDLSLISGLLKLASVGNALGTGAGLTSATGTRALGVDAISLLNLGDLLAGLNLDLAKLPLNIISTLLSALQLPLALPGGAADLKSAVDGILTTVTGLLTQIAGNNSLLGAVVNTVQPVLTILNGLNLTSLIPLGGSNLVPLNVLNLGAGTVQGLLSTLQGTLSSLLGSALNLLGNLPLLKLDGASIGATTKAADTLANSVADVTAKVGGLNVLGLQLPGVDLISVGNLVSAITSQLGNVLGIISPDLKNLVHIGILEKATSLTTANGYNNALAGIDIVNLKITPPALLSNLINGLTGNGALSALGILGSAGASTSALPVLGGGLLGLGNLLNLGNLGSVLGILSDGLQLKIGSVTSSSQFRVASAPAPAAVSAVAQPVPAPVEQLPRTGGDLHALGILAAGMATLALGVRRWARRRPEETI